jgi:hypothetical protein
MNEGDEDTLSRVRCQLRVDQFSKGDTDTGNARDALALHVVLA